MQSLWKRYRNKGFAAVILSLITYPFRLYKRRLREAFIDKCLGVDTRGPIGLLRLRVPYESFRYATGYEPSDPSLVRQLLKEVGRDFSSFTFVDVGCGKGRALVVAGEAHFGRLIGVEFVAQFAEAAKRNCEHLGLPAKIFNEDAPGFTFPGGNEVVYLYNPFGLQVLSRVLTRLLAAPTEECYVIYVNPVHRELLDKCPRMTCVSSDARAGVWRLAPLPAAPQQGIPSGEVVAGNCSLPSPFLPQTSHTAGASRNG